MKVTYGFCLASELKVEDGEWPHLSFEREGKHVSIEKPLPRAHFEWEWDSAVMHPAVPPPPEAFAFQAGRDELAYTLVKVEITPPDEVGTERLHDETRATALVVLQELASWVRVLTRQYWVGRRGRDCREQKYVLYLGDFGHGKPSQTSGAGWGFDPSRTLDVAAWVRVGRMLELGERPSASQLFFCDALLDIAEGNVPQAVAGLGVSCEVETYSLTQAAIRAKSEEIRQLYDGLRVSFKDSLRAVGKLGCTPFNEFDQDAYRLVLELYQARGKAVHKGDPFYREGGNVASTRTGIVKYVPAVEKLFAWAEVEKSRLALTKRPSGKADPSSSP